MNHEEHTTPEFDEAIAALKMDTAEAIKRSISHDESVDVRLDGSLLDFTDFRRIIHCQSADYDYAQECPRMWDVWGTSDDDECFRLKVYTV